MNGYEIRAIHNPEYTITPNGYSIETRTLRTTILSNPQLLQMIQSNQLKGVNILQTPISKNKLANLRNSWRRKDGETTIIIRVVLELNHTFIGIH